jgi:hypothetical protein
MTALARLRRGLGSSEAVALGLALSLGLAPGPALQTPAPLRAAILPEISEDLLGIPASERSNGRNREGRRKEAALARQRARR